MNHTDRQLGLPGRGLRYLQKNKRQTVAFMVCLGVSSLLWIMIKLNKHYNHELIRLEVSALGYQLLFNRLRQPGNLPLRLKPHQLRNSAVQNIRFITGQNMHSQLAGQLHPSTQIAAIHPDTLFFRLDEVVTRLLPVIPDMTLDFAPNYLLFDTVKIIPDSIKVTGVATTIDAIKGIRTQSIDIKQIDKSFSYRLKLINPAPNTIELEASQVNVSGEVTLFTDLLVSVPVIIPDTFKTAFNTTPMVEVNCRVPESKRNTFDTKSIIATIGQIQTTQTHTHLQIVVNAPSFVKQITLSPAYLTVKTPTE